METGYWEICEDQPQEPANMMNDIMGGFRALLEEKIAKQKSSMTEEFEAVLL